jgi:hypothetical protein
MEGRVMPDDQLAGFATSGNGPRYDASAAAAVLILKQFDPSQPMEVLYGRILFAVLDAIYQAESELVAAGHLEAGENQ